MGPGGDIPGAGQKALQEISSKDCEWDAANGILNNHLGCRSCAAGDDVPNPGNAVPALLGACSDMQCMCNTARYALSPGMPSSVGVLPALAGCWCGLCLRCSIACSLTYAQTHACSGSPGWITQDCPWIAPTQIADNVERKNSQSPAGTQLNQLMITCSGTAAKL